MKKSSSYTGFTMVEMLVVMAIIVVLIGLGYGGYQYAIQTANRIAQENAAKVINQAATSYYAENGEYPGDVANFSTLMNESNLGKYIDSFEGGNDATYIYLVDTSTGDSFLICISLGGVADEKNQGYVCAGNGFSNSSLQATIDDSSLTATEADDAFGTLSNTTSGVVMGNWSKTDKGFDKQ